ncbi:hypothetical protein MASR2M78_16530 [Treponema sp.]
MPVEATGFEGVPDAGDPLQVVEDEKGARGVSTKRQELKRFENAKNVKKITLDNLYDSIHDGEIQELKVIIKGDVQRLCRSGTLQPRKTFYQGSTA